MMNHNNLALFFCLAAFITLAQGDDTTNAALKPAPPPKPIRAPIIVAEATPLPVEISATDPAIRYIARWNYLKGDPRAQWSGTSLALQFQGTDLNAKIEDGGRDVWQVEVDGKPTMKLALGKGTHLYNLASGLPAGAHTVRLMKSTEAFCGITQIHGFQLSAGGSLAAIEPATRHLEVIGDSISCGLGDEGSPNESKDVADWENAYNTYGAITARRFGADYACVAWSGFKMWPDRMIPDLYDDILTGDKSVKWDFSKFIPDAILINLSGNDFGWHGPDPDEAGWTGAYEAFIARLRGHYPNAVIFCASCPMIGGAKLAASKTYLQKVVADVNAAGDKKVEYLEFASMDYKTGVGGAGHPNVLTNQIMSDKWSAQLEKDLGWTPVTSSL